MMVLQLLIYYTYIYVRYRTIICYMIVRIIHRTLLGLCQKSGESGQVTGTMIACSPTGNANRNCEFDRQKDATSNI